jgi:hypothetical protein
MHSRRLRPGLASTRAAALVMVPLLLTGPVAPVAAAGGEPQDVSLTSTGKALAAKAAQRFTLMGFATSTEKLRVWSLEPGEYLIAGRMPANFTSSVTLGPDGRVEMSASYTTPTVLDAVATSGMQVAPEAVESAPYWGTVNWDCFARDSNTWGWFDTCYKTSKLYGETDSRDYWTLEQYGTAGASIFGKIYSASLSASRNGSGSTMSWLDWKPRSTVTGSCVWKGLTVSALGVSLDSGGILCEKWVPTKYADAGHFANKWDCGCIWPFGQPYPNEREVDLMQTQAIPQGGWPVWNLYESLSAFT